MSRLIPIAPSGASIDSRSLLAGNKSAVWRAVEGELHTEKGLLTCGNKDRYVDM